MRIPVEWLTEYVDAGMPVEELADRLTMAGLEVEQIDAVSPAELVRGGGVPDEGDSRVLVTKVTPNRGDWLSIIGVAREISAVTRSDLRIPDAVAEGVGPETGSLIKISIADPDLCSRYVGMVVQNVTIQDSPAWLKNRLVRAGMRPINNVVDITNYVMLEFGQPLHAFDYELLRGSEIVVRRAREGETMVSIDLVERHLAPEMLVIADRDRAVAIAGVMGGADTEVNPSTRHILLESANFDSVSIRRTSKTLGMTTESSYRFERKVDIGITDAVARRAAEMMTDLAGGQVAQGIVDAFPGRKEPRTIELRPERVNWLLDTDLTADDIISHLRALKIAAKLKDRIIVTVPTFRPDIELEADVIEEVARIHGYENIGITLPSAPLQGRDSAPGRFIDRLRGILMACGVQEALTHSLTDPQSVEVAGLQDQGIAVRNPLSEDASQLRAMLVPGLLQVILRNQAFGIRDMSIFEIGKVYRQIPDRAITEFRSVAGVIVGSQWASSWSLPKEALAADFYLAKGVVGSVLDRLGVKDASFVPVRHPLFHPTRAARIVVGDADVGLIGEVSPEVRERLDIRGRPYAFEIDVDRLMAAAPTAVRYEPAPRFPALYRHLAIVVQREVPYIELRNAIVDSGGEIVESVDVLDVYTGPQVGPDERSLTLSMVFRSSDRTLKDGEVNDVMESIKARLASGFQAKFRG